MNDHMVPTFPDLHLSDLARQPHGAISSVGRGHPGDLVARASSSHHFDVEPGSGVHCTRRERPVHWTAGGARQERHFCNSIDRRALIASFQRKAQPLRGKKSNWFFAPQYYVLFHFRTLNFFYDITIGYILQFYSTNCYFLSMYVVASSLI